MAASRSPIGIFVNACLQARSVAMLNRLELEPKWLRTPVLALLLKLLLECIGCNALLLLPELALFWVV